MIQFSHGVFVINQPLGFHFYLLSGILPLTVLFLLVTFVDISFTLGKLNSFIFFTQMYDALA